MLSYHKSVDAADYDTLYHYVESGQVNEAREMLDEVCRERRLSSISGNQFKKLLLAAERTGQISMIKLLLEHEPDYRTEFSDEKLSALCIAILYGHLDSAELLLRSGSVEVNGADLEARDYRGRTALHCAVSQGRVREAKLLLDKGADVNVSDCEGETPLLAAAQSSEADELLPLLMKRGADATAKDLWGRNALHNLTCAPGDHVDLARVLIEKGVSLGDRESLFEHQPIHTAAFLKKDKLVKLYLENSDLNTRESQDSRGRTILYYAARRGHVQLAQWIVENHGILFDGGHERGETALLAAALNVSKTFELVPLLLKHGIDINVTDWRHRNILQLLEAVPGKYAELVRVLIEKGTPLEAGHTNYQYLLHFAVHLENDELVNLYLDHCADVDARVFLLTAYIDASALYFAAGKKNVEVVKSLIRGGASLGVCESSSDRTALHMACEESQEENITFLLCSGADPFVADIFGNTPFDLINDKSLENINIRLLIKLLAVNREVRSHCSERQLRGETILKKYKWLWKYYQGCFKVIARMRSTRFIETCSFYELLLKSSCAIAKLMQNHEFETKFEMYDLNKMSMFCEDLLAVFNCGKRHHQSRLEQEDVIIEAVYNILPDLVVRKIVDYIFDCCWNV